ncbi:hypothetical protein LJ753_16570 [Arthrobacter sp. zg-Y20]|uniref:hypothetical protein n=1 Tax=unclassified Arthrobacter TaxID=235627 RepID=UPI001D14957A|nr:MULTISPECIES: hypothetical protein [unclassified Arthrobacter]MCC3277479.1 hypothetical protein [Arthrobacter sp. zg-Y20]MDK1317640.1 hypothetical protein [Arthrobacter sp. zg.Y20]WIB07099.1 hypothetical protein QNO06_05050 [Arthrobacter sp. zg-Y20]
MSSVEVTRVEGKPRWRLAYCHIHNDGYRGGKLAAEKWATRHVAEYHPDEMTPESVQG